MGQPLRGDAHALILNGDPGVSLPEGQAQPDAAARGAVLDGVVRQHPQHLLDQPLIGLGHHRPVLPLGQEHPVGADHLLLPQHLLQQGGQLYGAALHRLGVVVPPGQEQQLLHQLLHGGGLAADGGDGLLKGLRVVLAPAVQQSGVALDHGDGGAQLMAGVRDKAGLSAVGGVQPLQHGVDGLGQGPQLLLGVLRVDAAVQMGGVDLVQLSRQILQPPAGGEGGVVQPGGGGGELLNGAQHRFDGPVVPQGGGQQGQSLPQQQGQSHPFCRRRDGVELYGDGIGLIGVVQLRPVVCPQIPAAQGAGQLRTGRQEGQRGDGAPLRSPVQGGDGVVAGLHPHQGVRRGHPPLLHQSGHIGAAVFRVEYHAAQQYGPQDQIQQQEKAQLPQEQAGVQPVGDGGAHRPHRVRGRGAAESVGAVHIIPPGSHSPRPARSGSVSGRRRRPACCAESGCIHPPSWSPLRSRSPTRC